MIIVTIELKSAITGKTKELGQMRICNDGTSDNPQHIQQQRTIFND